MGLAVTPGTGATLATDVIATEHYEYIKLVSAEVGSTERIDKDANTAYVDGHVGVQALAIRNEADVDLATAELRYAAVAVDRAGSQYVKQRPADVWTVTGNVALAGGAYTEGDVDATITGMAAMWEDVGDTLRPVSAAKPLPVNVVLPATVPVSGAVTANIGTSGALALDATLTGGTQKSVVRGGAKGATAAADVTSTASGADHQPIDVAIYDAAGNQVTAFGGGTEFAEDTPHVTGDFGTQILGVRNDSATILTSVDGDYSPIAVDARGSVRVANGAAVFQVQLLAGANTIGAVTGPLGVPIVIDGAVVDNAAFADAATRVVPAGYIFDEVAGTALTENDAAAARVDAKRAVVGVIEDEATRGRRLTITASNAAKVDGSDVTQPITAAALPLPAGAATEATLSAASAKLPATLGQKAMAASMAVVLASDQSALTVASHAVTNAGTFAVQADTELPAAALLGDATANPTTPLAGAALEVFNGATWDRARGDVANGLDVDVTRLPALVASTARIGRIEFNLPATPQGSSTPINVAASGDNIIVAAVAGQTVRVHKFFLKAGGAVNAKWRNGSGGSDFHPALPLASGEGWVLDLDAEPWFVTSIGNALVVNLSAAVQVSGVVYYTQSA